MNQPEKAIADTEEAIRFEPKYAVAFTLRALIRASRGDYDGALADLDDTAHPTSELNKGERDDRLSIRFMILMLKRDFRGALAANEEMIPRAPKGSEWGVWFVRMELLSVAGELDQALTIADGFVGSSPENPLVWAFRAQILQQKKQYDRAKADYDVAIQLYPKSSGLYVSRAMLHKRRHDYRRALADLNEAGRLAPDDPEVLDSRAWFLATCPDASVRNGRAALDLARRSASSRKGKETESLDTLAAAEAEVGDFAAAVRTQQEAIALIKNPKGKFLGDARKRLALYQAKRPYHDDGRDEQVMPAGHVPKP